MLLEEWATIEGKLKDSEHLARGVIVPAINELRYAGRRLLMVANIVSKARIKRDEVSELRKELILARQYLQNADHDIADAYLCI